MFEDMEMFETAIRLLDDDQVNELTDMCQQECVRRVSAKMGAFTAISAPQFDNTAWSKAASQSFKRGQSVLGVGGQGGIGASAAPMTATQVQAQMASAQTKLNHTARQMLDNAQLGNLSNKWNWFGK